ncbi:sulfide/dihydroorotate dehydrogenase-like FAD/NAD-binding protein [Tropicimonas aquimaris]|uniref:Sulfide/dihydroorotate dehydrogenase-like FAD/NAD-binding protein n=1 Tax=Tropicimonas aquimaris TaxID=914152 RepID=A0ABW3ITJ5_9RHOB
MSEEDRVPGASAAAVSTPGGKADRGGGFPVVDRQDFSETTFLLEVSHPQMARAARPGQFVIVMLDNHGERIPLTIADFDREGGTITLVVQAVGKSSREMQARMVPGARLFGLVGPMGIPSEISDARKVICVGGGLGVAPIYPQARAFKEAGAYVIGVVGFRSRELIFWEQKFRDVCDEFVICTDDGSAGIKGLVTQGIEQAIAAHGDIDEVVAIGPPIMMRACAETTRPHGIKTMVSLNPIMVDGTGMCGGCRVRVGGRIRFACVDGPDFDGHEVDFDDLMARLARYRPQEREALDRYDDSCRRLAMAPAGAPSEKA